MTSINILHNSKHTRYNWPLTKNHGRVNIVTAVELENYTQQIIVFIFILIIEYNYLQN